MMTHAPSYMDLQRREQPPSPTLAPAVMNPFLEGFDDSPAVGAPGAPFSADWSHPAASTPERSASASAAFSPTNPFAAPAPSSAKSPRQSVSASMAYPSSMNSNPRSSIGLAKSIFDNQGDESSSEDSSSDSGEIFGRGRASSDLDSEDSD